MRLKQLQSSAKNKYTQLLLVLLLAFVAYAFFSQAIIADLILSLILLGAIVVIITTFYLHKRFFYCYLFISLLAFVVDFIEFIYQYSNLKLAVATNIIYGGFFLLAIVLMIEKIFSGHKVTIDTIVGGINVFLLIGTLWVLFFETIYLLNPKSFTYSAETINSFDLLYFSFTTLTTVGYGDITPVSPLAKALTNLEGICGVMYPAVLIGRLVGIYNPEAEH
ncbi:MULTISPECIES: potassium channel family protein [Moorena]|uniref:Ion channel n=1 Tax=Moorena producens 3L TaxID=489825 RepID=F4XQQ7_9CYAN|nr:MULTISPECIES: potassium channel family protein [Moorena]NEQ15760.1 ion transporter [Moorena sp. SIO3E2]EGJ33086.1 Ion channel [Moorena producens 3L]NEP30328.1 ion transporter [Moorena sp. SIO3B2]NEP64982.1 ion transporter [Moorena sp. SIO3A5]NEQ09993.1 ion transporter [Moorena sp. SIO4E2]